MPVSSLMAGVFSINTMLQAGHLPGSLWAVPSLLHPHGGQTYCFLSWAGVLSASVANANEPATTKSLRFIRLSFRVRGLVTRLFVTLQNTTSARSCLLRTTMQNDFDNSGCPAERQLEAAIMETIPNQ